jgi:hypothetical protein
MNNMSFTEDDKQKIVEYLNMVATHAEFKIKTDELVKYFKLLAHMQQSVLPKVNANILEVKRVVEAEAKEAEAPASEGSEE